MSREALSEQDAQVVSESMKLIGGQLRRLRKESNQSQFDIAKIANVTPGVVSMAENGRGTSFNTLIRLGAVYGLRLGLAFFNSEGAQVVIDPLAAEPKRTKAVTAE